MHWDMLKRTAATIGWILLVGHAGACNGFKRAEPKTANEALGEKGPECGAISDYATPLVVDLDAAARGDMEIAMREGIGVVAYDCDRFELLKDCIVEGDYAFMGYEKKEDVVRLSDSDELFLNLPFGAKLLGSKIGASLEREATLDIAMMLIGKHRTTRRMTTRGQLQEGRPGACAKATHFIRGASLGAFAMTSGSKSKTRGAAEIFSSPLLGGSGDSEKSVSSSSGEIEACQAAKRDSERPPEGCSAIVRLELTAIDDTDSVRQADNPYAIDVCSDDYVLTGGKCAARAAANSHLCKPKDYRDCQTQCDAGNAASCARVAFYHLEGEHFAKDEKKAAEMFRQTCEQGFVKGCASLGSLYVRGVGVERDLKQGVALVTRACEAGEARYCSFLGQVYHVGNEVPRDQRKAAEFSKLGCYGGHAAGCFVVGNLHRKGAGGLKKDPKKARNLFKRGCVGGDVMACYALAVVMQEGIGGPKDNAGALKLFGKLCDQAKMPAACKEAKR